MKALATFVLMIHAAWILWVIFGAFWTCERRLLAAFHVLSLLWGIIVEVSPWPCPLTLAEQFFEGQAGTNPYQGGFMLRWLDQLVYPAIPDGLITGIGVAVCGLNLAVYGRRYLRAKRKC